MIFSRVNTPYGLHLRLALIRLTFLARAFSGLGAS